MAGILRRRGIATALVVAATEAMAAAGVSRINIHVFAWNQPTLAFWAAMGFVPHPDIVTLQRRLGPRCRQLRSLRRISADASRLGEAGIGRVPAPGGARS